jgi:hypothetical protein
MPNLADFSTHPMRPKWLYRLAEPDPENSYRRRAYLARKVEPAHEWRITIDDQPLTRMAELAKRVDEIEAELAAVFRRKPADARQTALF